MTLAADALRPWALSPAVSRELRAMHRAARDAIPSQPLVFVVMLGGAFRPESIPSGAWRTVEGRPVAVAGLELARDLATGRSPSAAAALDAPPPAGGAWCLALAADGSALTWSTPLKFSAPAADVDVDCDVDPGVDHSGDAFDPPAGDA